MPQSSHQKRNEVAGDSLRVVRLAASVRQPLDPTGIGHQEDQRAEHELIAPVDLSAAALRKRACERRDDLLRDRIENLRNDAALERVGIARLPRHQPAEPGLRVDRPQADHWKHQRFDDELKATLSIRLVVRQPQSREPLLHDRRRAALEYRAIETILGTEVIADQPDRHLCRDRDLPHRNTVQPVLREQHLCRIEYLVARALLAHARSPLLNDCTNVLQICTMLARAGGACLGVERQARGHRPRQERQVVLPHGRSGAEREGDGIDARPRPH
jgi:hypothetical protein